MLRELDASEFDADVDTAGEATPVLFWATWCGHCKRFAPHFEAAAEGSARPFLTVDVSDESSSLWEDHDLQVVPTVVLLEDGEEVARIEGILAEEHLEALLTEHVTA